MASADHYNGLDAPDRLHRALHGRILALPEMCSGAVVIVSTGTEYVPEMPLVKDQDMIEAFTPDRADETFPAAILPA